MTSPRTEDVSSRALRIFTMPRQPREAPAEASRAGASAQGAAAATPEPRPSFSSFDPEANLAAVRMAARFIAKTTRPAPMTLGRAAAPAVSTDQVHAVLDEIEALAREDPEKAKYVLALFATHGPGRRYIRKPPVWMLFEEKFRSSPAVSASTRPRMLGAAAMGPKEQEMALAWWREDPLLNEHHYHWHVVFPFSGDPARPVPGSEKSPIFLPKDRQGELFFYMHRQMLARYDAERRCMGIDPVEPYSDFTQPIPVGYDARLSQFMPRPDDTAPRGVPGRATPADMQRWERNLLDAGRSGKFSLLDPPLDVTPTRLGGALEADADTPGYPWDTSTPPTRAKEYGNYHNSGHMLIANAVPGGWGVMADTATALRDPIFWRWHRHVDDVWEAWQSRLPPADFSDAPPVTIPAEGGVVVAFRDQIPGASDDADFDYDAWGRENVGFDDPRPPHATEELQTMMLRRTLHTYEWYQVATDTNGNPVYKRRPKNFEARYLDQREFVSFYRAENHDPVPRAVTLRVFLALEEFVDQPRMWIEMDRFTATLQPGRNVVARPAWRSAVIRKPCGKPPLDYDPEHLAGSANDNPDADSDSMYCDCGWPYNLLLPRGTAQGVKARLFVMATDYAKDHVGNLTLQDDCCGSMSFCGSKGQKYPDLRDMGYPFHRPFVNGRFEDTFAGVRNASWRPVSIRWTNPPGSADAPAEALAPQA